MIKSQVSPPNDKDNAYKFVVLDQTFVVFDIDQPRNAQQKLKINRLSGVGPVLWRFLTNAPTRYIVNPNSGTLTDDEPVEITITLYKNRYRPRHELLLQAIPAQTGKTIDEKIWETAEIIQTTHLDLGTTVINIEKAVENEKVNNSKCDLVQLLDASSSKGKDRVVELQDLLKMTLHDNEILKSNIEQSIKLKTLLQIKVEEKKKLVEEYKTKLNVIEGSYMRKSAEVERIRAHLYHCNNNNNNNFSFKSKNNQPNCIIS